MALKRSRRLAIARPLSIGLYLCLLVRSAVAAGPSQIHDFGTASVNGSGNAATLTFALSGVTALPTASVAGVGFSPGPVSCNSGYTLCSVTVTFVPQSAGLRQDGLLLKNSGGTLLASAFLHGIGQGPALQLFPAAISTLAGTATPGFTNGPSASAAFNNPQGLAIDAQGNIYVADSLNQVVRKIAANTAAVSTFAGNGAPGYSGDNGPAVSATLNTPTGVAVDAAGNLFIADQGNSLIRRVDAVSGLITTVAGGGGSVADGVPATTAALSGPNDLAIDTSGNLYISDSFHNLVREVTLATGFITNIAGGGSNPGSDGIGDGGPATGAQLSNPTGIAVDSAGNVYFADTNNSLVRRIDASSGVITVVAGNGVQGNTGDNGLATNARLSQPTAVRLDAAGNLYIADFASHVVRFVNAITGLISTIAGNGAGTYSGDGGVAVYASLNNPSDLALDSAGHLLIADYSNNVVRKIAFLPPLLTFPATNVSLTSPLISITVGNVGNTGLNLSSLAVSTPFHQETSGGTDCSASSVLASAATCQIALEFAPTAPGTVAGTLGMATNNANQSASPATVNLSGTGLAGTPAAALSPASLTFAAQTVGTTSATQTVTLSNPGTASLTAISVALSGANSADFQLTSTCGATLSASAGCTLSISFQPSLAGSRTATLTVFDSAAGSPQSVSLTGTGTGGPVAVLSASTLQFGSQAITTASATQTVTLTNAGSGTLSIYGIAMAGANGSDFGLFSTTCGVTLAPSASCALALNFIPAALGSRTASVLLTHSAGNSPQSVALSGTGVSPGLTVSPASVTFSYQATNSTSSPQTLTISNLASLAVTLSAPAITGTNAGDFHLVANNCPATLTSASCSLAITFAPSATGLRSATLTIPNTGSIPTQTIALSGVGANTLLPSLSASSLQFAAQILNAASTAQTVTLSNPNSFTLNISGIATTGTNAADFALSATTCGAALAAASSCNLNLTFAPTAVGTRTATLLLNLSTGSQSLALSGTGILASSLNLVPVTPCRIADTRSPAGPFGGPYLAGSSTRTIYVANSSCNIPANAAAYSLNITVVPHGPLGFLSAWPGGQAQPWVSTLNSTDGRVKANAAIISAGPTGAVSFYATDDTDLVLDINGYFISSSTNSGLAFYPLTPCRILDTRAATGALGGPRLAGAVARDVPILQSNCGLPPTSQAYSLNFTAVPANGTPLGYLATWPAGQPQPVVSTLNAPTAAVTANAAIVPAGSNGSATAYASNNSDLVIDVNGYFASPAAGGLHLYTVTPCRVLDTRNVGAGQPFSQTLFVPVADSCNVPPTATAVVVNATVVPSGPLGYLTLSPAGQSLPLASTLNAGDASVTSNMAIVPMGSGAINAYASNDTQLILDVTGYFAP